MWLSNGDWEQAVVKSVTAEFRGAAIINIVSRNAGMRWDLEAARRAIGYVPTDSHTPELDVLCRMKDLGARLRECLVPQEAPVPRFGARW